MQYLLKVSLLLICLLLSEVSFSAGNVVIPNVNLIGSHIEEKLSLFFFNHEGQKNNSILPESINIDINEEVITGIVCEYNKSISIGEVEKRISNTFSVSPRFVSSLPNTYIKVWRVTEFKTAIMLGKKESGKIELIYIKIPESAGSD